MPDITMCYGNSCPKKEECYRHTATANPWRQSYFVIEPLEEDNSCDYFTPDALVENERSNHKSN